MKKRNLKISGIMLSGIIIIVSLFYTINFQPAVNGESGWFGTYGDIYTFDDYDGFINYLGSKANGNSGWYCEDLDSTSKVFVTLPNNARNGAFPFGEGKSVDYSETNVQVEGVDEPDIVKTDGQYLYILSNSKIYIIIVNPAESAELLSIISFDEDIYINSFFINKNRLIAFGMSNRYPVDNGEKRSEYEYNYLYWNGISTTMINIFDISDKDDPILDKNIEIDGYFYDARMIANFVYIIANENIGYVYSRFDENISINIPKIKINDNNRYISPEDIYYVNSSESIESMTHIISIDIYGNKVDGKSFLLGNSQNLYVSNNNIFLACQENRYCYSYLEGTNYEESTIIHKISIIDGNIEYIAKGKIPGLPLNQFSMDEYDGFFRIATHIWTDSTTNLYILDGKMNRVSEIEGIAPGEWMHSARFMSDRAYIVTFKKVDPFYTIDVSDPYNPQILGILKIPGYSDYLHPFDENHIIGIGKDTVEALGGDFSWYQGLKIALFDVSDFNNPIVESEVIIGDRGTDSPVLYEHKAILFDREKKLLVLPVTLCEISEKVKTQYYQDPGRTYGTFTFQGAYVYGLSLEDGFELKGRITHMDDDFSDSYQWYWGSSSTDIIRSLYIDDILYTISNNMVMMNNLNDLNEINTLVLN